MKIGDVVVNASRSNAVSYITDINAGSDYIDIYPAIGSQASGDTYHVNVLPLTTTTSDLVYVPFLDIYETTGTSGSPGSESVSVVYDADRSVRIRVRQGGVILPFEADNTIRSTGMSQATIRTTDTIYSAP
jgi:hypothetical protein